MPESPNDKEVLKREIKNHFAYARYEDGLKLFIDFTQIYCPAYEIDAVLISGEFHELSRKILRKTITEKKAKIDKSQIIESALLTLNLAWLASGQKKPAN